MANAHNAHGPRCRGLGAWPWLLSLMLGLTPALANADLQVQMRSDRSRVQLGERVEVQIDVVTDRLQRPVITLPEFHDFSVVQQSVQRPTHFMGRKVSQSVHYTYILRPTRAGKLVIEPAVVTQGKTRIRSRPLTIIVTEGGDEGSSRAPPATANGSDAALGKAQVEKTPDYIHAHQIDPEAFIRTVIDKSEPYEREQVTITLYLYTHERLQAAPTVNQEASTDGFWTQDLLDGKTLERLPTQRVGRTRYHVYLLRRMAAFPLRSGELTVGAMSLTLHRSQSLFNLFDRGGPAPPLERTGVPITLEVQPLPKRRRPKGEVAVGKYHIEAELDRTQSATGDAVTLTATVTGLGHIQSIRIPTPKVPGLQILEPEIRDLVETEGDRVGGTRVFEWLLVPQQPGQFRLPPFRLHTFDPAKGKYKVISGPALTLVAAGRTLASTGPLDPPATGDSGEAQPPSQAATPKFGPVRTQSALSRGQEPLHTHPFFPLALCLPPLAFAAVWLRDMLSARAQGRSLSERERAERAARDHMRTAEEAAQAGDSRLFHAELANALQRALESRLGEPVGGYTRPELRKRIERSGMDRELSAALLGQLERCDSARFSPNADPFHDVPAALTAAKRVYGSLLTFNPDDGSGGS